MVVSGHDAPYELFTGLFSTHQNVTMARLETFMWTLIAITNQQGLITSGHKSVKGERRRADHP